MNKEMVDIIIPVYNAKKTLYKTLYSIAVQELVDLVHVYLIDDCSDETYEEEIELFSKKMKLTYYRMKKNGGPGKSRQYGIDHSRSKYIMFCDSDDVLADCYAISVLYDKISEGYDVVSSNVVEYYRGKWKSSQSEIYVLHAKMYRRSFLKKHNIRFPEIYYSEDYGFNLLTIAAGAKMGYCNYLVYSYIHRVGSLTGVADYATDKRLKGDIDCFNSVFNYIENNSIEQKNAALLSLKAIQHFYWWFSADLKNKYFPLALKIVNNYYHYFKYLDEESRNIDYRRPNSSLSFQDFIRYCREEYMMNHD